MSEELSWAHTRAEWDQAWSQARHLETMRGQWLAFFFTAVLGVAAVAGPRIDVRDPQSLVVIALLALVLDILSTALHVAVSRLNQVAQYYDQIILTIRDEMSSRPPAAVDLSMYSRPPAPPLDRRIARFASTKGISQIVLLFGVCLFTVVLGVDAIRAATLPNASAVMVAICMVTLVVGTAAAVFCFLVHSAISPQLRYEPAEPPSVDAEND